MKFDFMNDDTFDKICEYVDNDVDAEDKIFELVYRNVEIIMNEKTLFSLYESLVELNEGEYDFLMFFEYLDDELINKYEDTNL